MRKLRFEHGNQSGTHKKGWHVSKRELANLALAYGIVNRKDTFANEVHDHNVTNVTDAHNVTQRDVPINSDFDSRCFDDGNALAWQAQAGFLEQRIAIVYESSNRSP